jgi:hypothetical protein
MNNLPVNLKNLLSKLYQFQVDGEPYDVVSISDCIEAIYKELNTEDIGELIADAVHDKLITQAQGEAFLNVSVWSGCTNGSQLHITIEKWLEEANDLVRIQLALAQGTYPFNSLEKMTKILLSIVDHYPQFSEKINGMIGRRKIQGV